MKQAPFNPDTDLAPIPFDAQHCEMAAALKTAGIPWRPHVGCFVWDRDRHMAVPSPFPHRIYFILSLRRFQEIFGDDGGIQQELIWLPTWHQARELLQRMGVDDERARASIASAEEWQPGRDLLALYTLLKDSLQ